MTIIGKKEKSEKTKSKGKQTLKKLQTKKIMEDEEKLESSESDTMLDNTEDDISSRNQKAQKSKVPKKKNRMLNDQVKIEPPKLEENLKAHQIKTSKVGGRFI